MNESTLYIVQASPFPILWGFTCFHLTHENLKNINMTLKLFCPLKTFSFINKYNFGIYVQLNYEMRFNADEEGPNMFKCEIIVSMLNFCSVTKKYIMGILLLVQKKNLLAEGKTHLMKF